MSTKDIAYAANKGKQSDWRDEWLACISLATIWSIESSRAIENSLFSCKYYFLLALSSLLGHSPSRHAFSLLPGNRFCLIAGFLLDFKFIPRLPPTLLDFAHSDMWYYSQLHCLARQHSAHRNKRPFSTVGEHGIHLRQIYLRKALPGTDAWLLLDIYNHDIPLLFCTVFGSPCGSVYVLLPVCTCSHFLVLDVGISTPMDRLSGCVSLCSGCKLECWVGLYYRTKHRRAFFVYKVILFLFGLPIALFTVLLMLKLQWFPHLQLVVVFTPLWFMDCGWGLCVLL